MENRQASDYCVKINYNIRRRYRSSKNCNYVQWLAVFLLLILAAINYYYGVYPTEIGICISFITTVFLMIIKSYSIHHSNIGAKLSEARDNYILNGIPVPFKLESILTDVPINYAVDREWYPIKFIDDDIETMKFKMITINTKYELINLEKIKIFYIIFSISYIIVFAICLYVFPYVVIVFLYVGYFLFEDYMNIRTKSRVLSEIATYVDIERESMHDIKYIAEKAWYLQSQNRQVALHLPDCQYKD